ncbi:MAG: type II toxin-antitoxin system RelE/ParE family toxin [Pseudomonadota bacterium]
MVEIRQTETFARWISRLKDRVAKLTIAKRIDRLAAGHFGDVRVVGEGVKELRIHFGPGYRVYFIERSSVVIVLLCGGDKRTQFRDIEAAKKMARELQE